MNRRKKALTIRWSIIGAIVYFIGFFVGGPLWPYTIPKELADKRKARV